MTGLDPSRPRHRRDRDAAHRRQPRADRRGSRPRRARHRGAARRACPTIVVQMHTRSGLLDQIRASTVSLAEAGAQTLAFLRQHITDAAHGAAVRQLDRHRPAVPRRPAARDRGLPALPLGRRLDAQGAGQALEPGHPRRRAAQGRGPPRPRRHPRERRGAPLLPRDLHDRRGAQAGSARGRPRRRDLAVRRGPCPPIPRRGDARPLPPRRARPGPPHPARAAGADARRPRAAATCGTPTTCATPGPTPTRRSTRSWPASTRSTRARRTARILVDLDTPDRLEARLALAGWITDTALQHVLVGLLRVDRVEHASVDGLEIRAAVDDPDWAVMEELTRLDHLEAGDKAGATAVASRS